MTPTLTPTLILILTLALNLYALPSPLLTLTLTLTLTFTLTLTLTLTRTLTLTLRRCIFCVQRHSLKYGFDLIQGKEGGLTLTPNLTITIVCQGGLYILPRHRQQLP